MLLDSVLGGSIYIYIYTHTHTFMHIHACTLPAAAAASKTTAVQPSLPRLRTPSSDVVLTPLYEVAASCSGIATM